MKKIKLVLSSLSLGFCLIGSAQKVKATMDLVNPKDDKVNVSLEIPAIATSTAKFHFPKTVPGTYSVDDYGRFIEQIQFLDKNGKPLVYKKIDVNTYEIKNATSLAKITYWVNDSFDEEMDETQHKAVFSPSGTNIEEGKVYLVNTHGFIGYIDELKQPKYQIVIQKPEDFYGITALVDTDASENTDTFELNSYADVTDSPMMYSKPNYTIFDVAGMQVYLGVYSPNNVYKAEDLKADMEKMVIAQKKFLGDMNDNKKYAVMLYLASDNGPKIKGFGALEHHESTSVVLHEKMPAEMLAESIKDVVSHEFFHTVNPLKCHSEEIHYFDYSNPKMSKHLWMYEGGTEYFANLFQVQEGLIDKDEFLVRISDKIGGSKDYNDTMSFTEMSANVLQEAYKDQYRNVYEKGTLLTMCMDIDLLELSQGKMNYREMISLLSKKYGTDKPFKDDELINELVSITQQPQLADFYKQYIAGSQPTPYKEYLNKVGVSYQEFQYPIFWFIKKFEQTGYDEEHKALVFPEEAAMSNFANSIGLKPTDLVTAVDGKKIDVTQIELFIQYMRSVTEGQEVTLSILREENGEKKPMELKGKAVLDTATQSVVEYIKNPSAEQSKLQNWWLTGALEK